MPTRRPATEVIRAKDVHASLLKTTAVLENEISVFGLNGEGCDDSFV